MPIARTARIGLAALGFCTVAAVGPANAQTFGLATMQPGSLNHTTGTAIAKVAKEKGGLNTLVQADRRRDRDYSAGRARRGRVWPRQRP